MFVGVWVWLTPQALAGAPCSYSGPISWGNITNGFDYCTATLNETVDDGVSKSFPNTNAGYDGVAFYTCTNGVFKKTYDWCQVGAGPGGCGGSLSLQWSVFILVVGRVFCFL